MNSKFDELTKGIAQSVTRRSALKKFGVGLAGMALACFGLASEAKADNPKLIRPCTSNADCPKNEVCVFTWIFGHHCIRQ